MTHENKEEPDVMKFQLHTTVGLLVYVFDIIKKKGERKRKKEMFSDDHLSNHYTDNVHIKKSFI